MLKNFLSVFPSVQKNLKKELVSFLQDVITQLNEILLISDPLDRIVTFFNLISVYHDLNYELDKYDKILSEEDLSLLKWKIAQMGRSYSGMNRTSKGDLVTEYNVWLGNGYTLLIKPISEWKKSKDSQKGCGGSSYIYGIESDRLNSYDIVSLQAKYYVESNILNLKKFFQYIIAKLEK